MVFVMQSWRELFKALQEKDEKTRSSQGKRMRDIRRNVRITVDTQPPFQLLTTQHVVLLLLLRTLVG